MEAQEGQCDATMFAMSNALRNFIAHEVNVPMITFSTFLSAIKIPVGYAVSPF